LPLAGEPPDLLFWPAAHEVALSSPAMRRLLLVSLSLVMLACVALRDDMRRAEATFDEARYEDTETWLTHLEPQLPEMDRGTRARFYYLRGITAYRLGDATRAKHYLALARVESEPSGVGLREGWRSTLRSTLRTLGAPALPTERHDDDAGAPESSDPAPGEAAPDVSAHEGSGGSESTPASPTEPAAPAAADEAPPPPPP
jgi:hypothetical protein